MHRVESYVAGGWHRPPGAGRPLRDAATGRYDRPHEAVLKMARGDR